MFFSRIAIFVIVLSSVLTSRAWAELPPELFGRQIVSVEVVGESATMVSYNRVGIPIGAPLTRTLLRKTILRLAHDGRWANIQIDAIPTQRGVKLSIKLTAHVVVRRVLVSGNQELEEQQVLAGLDVAEGSQFSNQDLAKVESRVRENYAHQGYLKATVYATLRDTENLSRKDLIVYVNEGPATRIAKIVFRGDQPFNPARVHAAMKLDIGDVLNRRSVDEGVELAERYLREQGFLETDLGAPQIVIEQNRATLTIASRIGPRYQVVIRGSNPLKESLIYETLELPKQQLSDPMTLKGAIERIEDLYQRYGFLDATVAIRRIAGKKPNEAILLVQITTGKQLEVVGLNFAGVRFFEESFLRDQVFSYLEEDLPGSSIVEPVDSKVADDMSDGPASADRQNVPPPAFVDPQRIYYPPTYNEAIKHIVELYQAEGFLAAKVGPAQMYRFDRRRAVISIPVIEGPRTLLYRINLTGNEALGSRELVVEGGFVRDMPFSYLLLEEARLRMLRLYQERGYLFARIDPSVRFSPDRTRAEVTIQVVERFPVSIDRIVIRGAKRTDEALIRDLILFEPGDLYRPSLARESEEGLIALGVFSGVKVAPQDPDLPERIKTLEVVVAERPIQQLSFFAGVSTGQGLRGGFEYGYRNLFGEAIATTLRVQLGYDLYILAEEEIKRTHDEFLDSFDEKIERRITLGTTVPHIRGLPGLNTSVDLVHLRNNERNFGLVEYAVALTFRYPLARRLTLAVGGDLERNDLELFLDLLDLNASLADNPDGPRLRRLLLVPPGGSTLIAGHTTLSYDERDNPFVPTRGFFTSLRGEIARTLGTQTMDPLDLDAAEPDTYFSRFLKITFGISGYVPVGADVVLASQFRFGTIVHLFPHAGNAKPYTYPNRAFFMGGVDTIRGYFQDSMIPQDTADWLISHNRKVPPDKKIDPRTILPAGDAFLLLRNELRFPIVGLLNGGVFVDLGNLWSNTSEIDPTKLFRPSAGMGIRFATPVGPLALDYGVLLLRRKTSLKEPFGTLHFSIGLF